MEIKLMELYSFHILFYVSIDKFYYQILKNKNKNK